MSAIDFLGQKKDSESSENKDEKIAWSQPKDEQEKSADKTVDFSVSKKEEAKKITAKILSKSSDKSENQTSMINYFSNIFAKIKKAISYKADQPIKKAEIIIKKDVIPAKEISKAPEIKIPEIKPEAPINNNIIPPEINIKKTKPVLDYKIVDIDNLKLPETNLIKGDTMALFSWTKHTIIFAAIVLLAAGVVVGANMSLSYFGTKMIKAPVDSGIDIDYEQEIQKYSKQKSDLDKSTVEVFAFEKRLKALQDIFNKRIYWSNFFALLDERTLKTVAFEGFSGGTEGKYKLSGQAADFRSIWNQARAFSEDPRVKNVLINGGSLSDAAKESDDSKTSEENKDGAEKKENKQIVTFEMELEVDKNLFFKK